MTRVQLRRSSVVFSACSGALLVVRLMPQTFGVELNKALMPAMGAMGGVIARPQDLTLAVNANPATLT